MSEGGTAWGAQEEARMPQGLRFAFPCYVETRERAKAQWAPLDFKSKIDNEGWESEECMQLISGQTLMVGPGAGRKSNPEEASSLSGK